MKHFLGIDVSEHLVRAVVVDGDGAVVRTARAGADAARLVDEVTAGLTLAAAGVSIELTDAEGARPELPPALAGLPGAVTCRPGTAAVVAETWIGAARGASDAICLKIGDRVFAGTLLNGAPWLGAHGRAGSAAWLALNPVERQDYRKFGSLAAEVSNKGIARRLSWRIQAGDHSAVLEKAGDLESITALHVFDGARDGDGVSISVVRDTAKYIGMAVANLAVAIDPDVIVISGAVAAAGDLLLEPVVQECARRLPPGLAERIRIAMSPLGEDGIAIGAARVAMTTRA